MNNYKLQFAYFSPTAASIAASPAWTLLGTLTFPAFQMILNSNSNATLEFSIDGTNPFIFMPAGTGVSPASIDISLKDMGVVIPENTRIFARRINAGVTGNLRVTFVGSAAPNAP